MWIASVQSNMGEILLMQISPEAIAGKALLAFQEVLEIFCMGESEEIDAKWFMTLQSKTQEDLCNIGDYFTKAIISGDWDYTEDEYEFCKHRIGDLTKEMFLQALEEAEKAWTDINTLMHTIDTFIHCIKAAMLPPIPSVDPDYLLAELNALLHTLSLFRERGATKVRINIV